MWIIAIFYQAQSLLSLWLAIIQRTFWLSSSLALKAILSVEGYVNTLVNRFGTKLVEIPGEFKGKKLQVLIWCGTQLI